MNFGINLWDQHDQINNYTEKGINFYEDISKFVRSRIKIESEYAKELKKLAKTHFPKKKEDDYFLYTHAQAFIKYLKEIVDIAGQHEYISEKLQIYEKEMVLSINDFRSEKKRLFNEAVKVQMDLKNQIIKHDKAKKLYEKAAKEEEKARDRYMEMDKDEQRSKAEVYAARGIMTQKQQICDDYKKDYALELSKTNALQTQHYAHALPSIYNEIQKMDENRIIEIRKRFTDFSNMENTVIPILQKCVDGMEDSSKFIDPKKDIEKVIDRYRSGYKPPPDIEFQEYGKPVTKTPIEIKKKTRLKAASFSERAIRKLSRVTIPQNNDVRGKDEFFTQLPPIQRQKKLNEKINSLERQLVTLNQSRGGLEKMKDVAERGMGTDDPGTPKSSMGLNTETMMEELEKNRKDIENVQKEIDKFRSAFRSVEKDLNPASITANNTKCQSMPTNGKSSPIPNHHSSISELSEPSVCHTPNLNSKRSESPTNDNDNDSDEFELDPSDSSILSNENVVGEAIAIYTFKGESEGSLPIENGQKLHILERDTGDGWTRVRNLEHQDGFVPTTYIEIRFY